MYVFTGIFKTHFGVFKSSESYIDAVGKFSSIRVNFPEEKWSKCWHCKETEEITIAHKKQREEKIKLMWTACSPF